jgi:uncharacterized 2Fe-2S/4Fe-4S cluster protein (DUF4445 family)
MVASSYGQSAAELVQIYFPEFSFPCAGNHSCGKCLVTLTGAVSPVSNGERYLLRENTGQRLACFTHILGNCTIIVPQTETEQKIEQRLSGEILLGTPLYNGEYGVAVDIGTTTVVVYLFRRNQGASMQCIGKLNDQRVFGSDVLSRIVYCDEHSIAPLNQLIRKQLGNMLYELCRQADVEPSKLSGACITGNTTMLHILCGIEPHSLAVAPFTPPSLFGETKLLDLGNFSQMPCYLPHCISAYVGADITCSILASGMMETEETTLLIDVGTNGEMALLHQGLLTCCSAAAGPAFEGSCISCGMQAETGAIDRVWNQENELHWSSIGEAKPFGICGSGLIDCVAAARRAGLLDRKGRPNGQELLVGDSGIALCRADINKLLLAKAAIRAGIDTLLSVCEIKAEAVQRVVLCGGFGSCIDIRNAIEIGLLPEAFCDRTGCIGNAAGTGAGMVLQNKSYIHLLEVIALKSQTVELSANPFFKKRYIQCIYLP